MKIDRQELSGMVFRAMVVQQNFEKSAKHCCYRNGACLRAIETFFFGKMFFLLKRKIFFVLKMTRVI